MGGDFHHIAVMSASRPLFIAACLILALLIGGTALDAGARGTARC